MSRKTDEPDHISGILQMRWAEQYLKIPFLDRGRDAKGCDCWGLYRLIMRDQLGVELPEYPHEASDAKRLKTILRERDAGAWQRIDRGSEQPFDCVLMRGQFRHDNELISRPIHMGCVTTKGTLIHTEIGSGTTIVRYDHPAIKNRIEGFFRFKA